MHELYVISIYISISISIYIYIYIYILCVFRLRCDNEETDLFAIRELSLQEVLSLWRPVLLRRSLSLHTVPIPNTASVGLSISCNRQMIPRQTKWMQIGTCYWIRLNQETMQRTNALIYMNFLGWLILMKIVTCQWYTLHIHLISNQTQRYALKSGILLCKQTVSFDQAKLDRCCFQNNEV